MTTIGGLGRGVRGDAPTGSNPAVREEAVLLCDALAQALARETPAQWLESLRLRNFASLPKGRSLRRANVQAWLKSLNTDEGHAKRPLFVRALMEKIILAAEVLEDPVRDKPSTS